MWKRFGMRDKNILDMRFQFNEVAQEVQLFKKLFMKTKKDELRFWFAYS